MKIWLITGGTEGIGKALYEYVKLKGNKAIICSRSDSNDINHHKVDVSDSDQVQRMVEHIIWRYGRIDVLINNASVYQRDTIENTSIEFWNECININLNGSFYFCKYVLPYMKIQNNGCIINMLSYVIKYFPPERSAYTSSKLALLGLTKTLSKEVENYKIKVNAFSPWKTSTKMDIDGTAKVKPEEVAKQIYDIYECDNTGQFFIENEKVEMWQ